MVSVVMPALNEEKTVGPIIRAMKQTSHISEIIVVNDGSTDGTARVAAVAGAKVITLPVNSGKGNAMAVGVKEAKNNLILFFDADLFGVTPGKIETIIKPVLDGRYDMYVGIRSKSSYWLNKVLRFFPIIGGERILTREVWDSVPLKFKKNQQIDVALNYHTKIFGRRMGFEMISGMNHIQKEKKYGFIKGFPRRLMLYWDIVYIAIRLYVIETLMMRVKALKHRTTEP